MSSDLEERLKENISQINNKINERRGEVILCARDFYVPGEITGDFAPPVGQNYYHYEAGLIGGRIKKEENTIRINPLIPSLSLNPLERSYSLIGDYSIPIKRKISGFINADSFYWKIKDLENIKDGEISINSLRELSNIKLKDKYLREFSLLIGNEEVRNFLNQRKIKNPEELFKTLQNEDFVNDKIDKYYTGKRTELANELVWISSDLKRLKNELDSIRENVLSSNLSTSLGQDGVETEWSNDSVYSLYDLKKKKIEIEENLPKLFKRAKEINLSALEKISGEVIGFPASITVNEFVDYTNSLLSSVTKLFQEMGAHIKEQEKKAYS